MKKYTLPNGVRVLLVEDPNAKTSATVLMMKVGTEHEKPSEKGYAHFLEHALYQSTSTFSEVGGISLAIENEGSDQNAYTGYEYTGFYILNNFPGSVFKSIDILSDLVIRPTFPRKRIANEKRVILNEMKKYQDDPADRADNLLRAAFYGNQSAGWDILGTRKIIQSLSCESLLRFKNVHYHAENALVVVSGKFNQEKVLERIRKRFSSLEKLENPPKKKPVNTKPRRNQIVLSYSQTKQTHIALGIRTTNLFDTDAHGLEVLSAILTEGTSSRIYMSVREKHGMCYKIDGVSDLSQEHGFLSISVNPDNDKAHDSVSIIVEELRRLRERKVKYEELSKAKKLVIGEFRNDLQTPYDKAEYFGRNLLLSNSIESRSEFEKKVNDVSPVQIMRLANTYFTTKNLALAVIGPHRSVRKFKKLLVL